MDYKKRISILILTLIGLGLSIELCHVYINANFIPNAAPSICAINSAFNCDSVAKTSYSQFLGIPLAVWGVCLYLFILFMNFVDKIQNCKFLGFLKVFKNPASYIFCISALSFVISMCLGCISIFKIKSVCIFCFMTYIIDLLIAITSKDYSQGLLYELKNSCKDFIEAIKVKRYAISFGIIVIIASLFLCFTNETKIFTGQSAFANYIMAKQSLGENNGFIKFHEGNILGPEDAEIEVHEFIDFNCGGCYLANIFLHRIVDEFENIKVIQHNVPLQKACNHNMVGEGHSSSCIKAKYALAAAKQNKYWIMSNLLFFSDNVETEDDILHLSNITTKFDLDKLKQDANSEEVKKELEEAVLFADSKGVEVTPTIFIGIKKLEGIGSYPELKEIIIGQGGKEKAHHE